MNLPSLILWSRLGMALIIAVTKAVL